MAAGTPMQGTLFKYGPLATNVAFVTGEFNRHLILVGGTGDGLLFAPYCKPLAEYLNGIGWGLVQTLLSSSHLSYGLESLDTDADEIHLLAAFLQQDMGSKDAVRYAKRHGASTEAPPVLGYILQAPVSDREAQSEKPEAITRDRLIAAQLMVTNGEAEEILFRDWEMRGAPICARRFLALVEPEGDDDMFSSDLTAEKLKEILGCMEGVPTLLLSSAADEYVPETVDKDKLVKSLAAAAGSTARGLVIPDGVHNLKGSEQLLLHHVAHFMSAI